MGCTSSNPAKGSANLETQQATSTVQLGQSSSKHRSTNTIQKNTVTANQHHQVSAGNSLQDNERTAVTDRNDNAKDTVSNTAPLETETLPPPVSSNGPRILSQLELDLEKVDLIEDTIRDNLALLKGPAYNPDDELIINNQYCEDLRAAARANEQARLTPNGAQQGLSLRGVDRNSNSQTDEVSSQQKTSPRAYQTHVGLKLMCRDEFQSKYTKKLMYRWREIEVLEVQGKDNSLLFVHFIGWANSFDHWLDMHADVQKIAAPNILSKDEIESGKMLTDDQILATKEFLIYGEIKAPKPIVLPVFPVINKSSTSDSSVQNEKELRPDNSVQPQQEKNGEAVDSYSVGMKLDVLDIYYKRGSNKPHEKWREAQVIHINGENIKINYIGWDNKFDETLDVKKQGNRVARHLTKANPRPVPQTLDPQPSNSKPAQENDVHSARINLKKTNSFLKKFDPESFLKKLNRTAGQNNNAASSGEAGNNGENVNETNAFDTTFFGSRFGQRILNKLNINGLQRSSVGEQDAKREKKSVRGRRPDTNDDEEEDSCAHFAAQFNDPNMKTSAQLAAEIRKEKQFIEVLAAQGLTVVEIEGDGNCMFRAISHQLFLNEDQHEELRRQCVEHLIAHKARFSMFCFNDFDRHVEHMMHVGVWGDELELRALEEIIDRPIRIFSSDAPDQGTPLSNNFEELTLLNGVVPITLSYHGSNHYNSVNDVRHPLPLRMRNTRILFKSREALFNPNGGKADGKSQPEQSKNPRQGTNHIGSSTTTTKLQEERQQFRAIELQKQHYEKYQQQQSQKIDESPPLEQQRVYRQDRNIVSVNNQAHQHLRNQRMENGQGTSSTQSYPPRTSPRNGNDDSHVPPLAVMRQSQPYSMAASPPAAQFREPHNVEKHRHR